MKLFFIFSLVSILVACHSSARNYHCVVSVDKSNLLFVNVPNPISIGVTGLMKNDFTLSIDNGSIYSYKEKYFIEPNNVGKCLLVVCIKNIKYEHFFTVKKLDTPLITTTCFNNLADLDLRNVSCLHVGYMVDYDVKFEVMTFDCIVKSPTQNTIYYTNKGSFFNPPLKQILDNINLGDTVIFENVWVKFRNGNMEIARPLIVPIKN
jgi:hypothetical protein